MTEEMQRERTTVSGRRGTLRDPDRGSGSRRLSRDEQRRESALRARKRRRRNRMFIYFLVVLLVAGLGAVLSLTVFFSIKTIDAEGGERYCAEKLVEVSGIRVGENMFLLKRGQVADRLEKGLPYVESVQIRLRLSGVVTIRVTSASPRLALDDGESFTLLSEKGKVLEKGLLNVDENIIILSASRVCSAVPGELAVFENEDDLPAVLRIVGAMDEKGLSGISALDITEPSDVRLVYRGRILLKLGGLTSVAGKLNFVRATLGKVDADKPDFEGTIDFTIEKKAYLKPKELEPHYRDPPSGPGR